MAYEIEAVSSTPSPSSDVAPVMREAAVYDPYKGRTAKKTPSEAPIGQPDKIAEPGAEELKPTEETVKLSPQVAALARKEQKFRQQQQELEKAREALEADKVEVSQLKAMKAKLASKDYSGLDDLVDYNEYSQYQVAKLNGTDPTQVELNKLKTEVESLRKSGEEMVTKQFEAAVSERRLASNQLVDKNPDKYPRIKKANAQEAIVQHILDTWEHDSKELTVEEAAKEVEEILVEKAKQWAALLEEEKVAAVEDEKKPLPPLKQGLKTLTNQVIAGEIKRPSKSFQGMSDSERWAEARRRVEGRDSQKQSR